MRPCVVVVAERKVADHELEVDRVPPSVSLEHGTLTPRVVPATGERVTKNEVGPAAEGCGVGPVRPFEMGERAVALSGEAEKVAKTSVENDFVRVERKRRPDLRNTVVQSTGQRQGVAIDPDAAHGERIAF